jgi:hypothetical protein
VATPAIGIDLHHTVAGHIFEKAQRAKLWCTRRRGSKNVIDVRATRYARAPRYTVEFTLDSKGEPVSALCVDRWGEQCKANEFRGGCYHVAAALLRFYRRRLQPGTKGKVLLFHRRSAA